MVPIKSVVHLYFFLHKTPPIYLHLFSTLVHLLKVSRLGLKQVPLKCLLGHYKMEAGRNRKKSEKQIQIYCFIPFTVASLFFAFLVFCGLFFLLFVIQHRLAYYFRHLFHGGYYLRFINSEVFSQINHFIS